MVGAASAGTGSIYIYIVMRQCIFSAHKFAVYMLSEESLHKFNASQSQCVFTYLHRSPRTAVPLVALALNPVAI